jgi:hypothetical protein
VASDNTIKDETEEEAEEANVNDMLTEVANDAMRCAFQFFRK